MWEIDIGIEATALLWSIILGVGSAVLYDAVRAVNKVFKPNTFLVFVLDVLYWLILTFVFFCFFMVFTNGQVRMFAIFGAVSGFLLGFLCFFKIPLVLFSKFFTALRFVFYKIKAFFACFGRGIEKIAKKIKKTLKKALLKIKKA
jgi:hypothetical protein